MYLLPKPQSMIEKSGFLKELSVRVKEYTGDERITKALKKLPCSETGTELVILLAGTEPESYTLTVDESKITIIAADEPGVFYAIQTLRQLFANGQVPCLVIQDKPDFAYRGFYHDITRGKVPTVKTLKSLIDTLAYYKINSLQLYVEHTFPFKELGDLVEKTGYLTAEEIKELDDYCYENFIEFIPSLSTFGHLYELLQRDEYKELQETENFEDNYIFWGHRMAHHTINPTMEKSIETIKSMLDQYVPLFRTDKFNICCDETFDLQHGKHKGQDTGKLYIDFVKKIVAHLQSKGKTVMMWADILLLHPETIQELPEDMIFLNWNYDANPKESQFETFGNMDRVQIVCPGTTSWSRLVESVHVSTRNILTLGDYGYKYHAKGMLNTNWGDFGNPCSLELAMYGLVLGAAKSWNHETTSDTYFADSINALLYAQEGALDYVKKLDEIHSRISFYWNDLCTCYSNCIYENQRGYHRPSKEDVLYAQTAVKEILDKLSTETWKNDEYRQEILVAAEGILVMAELFAKFEGYDIERISDTGAWLNRYSEKWMQKNKASELCEIQKMFITLEDK